MDFNDLVRRVERLYSALGQKADGEIQKHIKIRGMESAGSSEQNVLITFDNTHDEAGATNIVLAIIEHLAKLKDHLKRKVGESSHSVENMINQSLDLQLIMDLSNSEKHGYPLTRPARSHRSPRVLNIRATLAIPPQEQIGINIKTGEVVHPGKCQVDVRADVVDGSGKYICEWFSLVDRATQDWTNFIREHGLN